MEPLIEIKNLSCSIEGKPILKGMNLKVFPGEVHAIMGPNGAGKSTLAKIMAGHPAYEVTNGEILFSQKNILELEPEERALLGIFMSFQYPPEIAGVSNEQFLREAFNAKNKALGREIYSEEAFKALLQEKMEFVEMKKEFVSRNVNEGFSGGEKKRNEILQMAILDPLLSILDETDSGLDIDAMRIVARGVNRLLTPQKGLILITHYQRLLEYIPPHVVHVMIDGQIVESGPLQLALHLEDKGYDAFLHLKEDL